MKKIYVLQKDDSLSELKKQGYLEIIFALECFSRLAIFEKKEALERSSECRQLGMKPVLEWDFLMTDSHFEKAISFFDDEILSAFDAIRIQDLGLLSFLEKISYKGKIQLLFEHGNHNLESLLSFSQVSSKIERLVLSPQIPRDVIFRYSKELKIPVEILYKGHLLLSYTPRHLLSRLNEKEVVIKCLEGEAFKLHALEKNCGTMIFYDSFFSLEKNKESFSSWENCYFRVDRRLEHKFFSSETTVGFFEKNESTEIFTALKNTLIERQDGAYVGEVIDVIKEHYIGISLAHPKRKLKKGDELHFKTPEGRLKDQLVTKIFNFLLEEVDEGKTGEIVFIPHRSGVSVRSSVYFKDGLENGAL